jgi:hypothetical protein
LDARQVPVLGHQRIAVQYMKFLLSIQDFARKLSQVVETLVRIALLSRFRVTIPETDQEECILLGNGPSLKQDLEKYAHFPEGKDLICVNHFPSTDLFEKLKPATYITSAPDLWLDDIDKRFVNQSKVLFDNLARRTTWPLEFYIPFEAARHRRWQEQVRANPHITIRYYNNVPMEGWQWFAFFCFNRKWGMPRPHNVMIPSMMIALWKKYRTIYLLGADHSWLKEITVTETNEVLINQKHFYDEHESKSLPLDKRGKGKRNLAELLYKFMTAFASYFEIRYYAQHRGCKILNATKGSYIDAFERVALNE